MHVEFHAILSNMIKSYIILFCPHLGINHLGIHVVFTTSPLIRHCFDERIHCYSTAVLVLK